MDFLEWFMHKVVDSLKIFKSDEKSGSKSIRIVAKRNIDLLHSIGDWICDAI